MSDVALLEVESDQGNGTRDDPDNLLGMVAWMAANSSEQDPPEVPDPGEPDEWGAADADTPTPAGPKLPTRRSMIAEAVWAPDLHPRDRIGRWRATHASRVVSRAMTEDEWNARSQTVHALYHYGEPPVAGQSSWGHGGTAMSPYPRADIPGEEHEYNGAFHLFVVKDHTHGPLPIQQGKGDDPAFNRLLAETAREVALPDTPSEGYSYDQHGAWHAYARQLEAHLAEKLRERGYDGIWLGGEVLMWNYDKLPQKNELRDYSGGWNPIDTPHKPHGPLTQVTPALEERAKAAGIASLDGLQEIPQHVTDETLRAVEAVRRKIKPNEKAPDPLYMDVLGIEHEGDPGPVMTTWYDPADGQTAMRWNVDEWDELADRKSFAADQGFVSWASRDPYGRALHEMGHVYERHATRADQDKVLYALEAAGLVETRREGPSAELEWRWREPAEKLVGFGRGVRADGWPSIYAQKEPAEAFAEMFALLMRPEALNHYEADHTKLRRRLIAFREKWNEQMREDGYPTIPETPLP